MTSGKLTDAQMAQAYAAMNVTLGIGSGEGMGYPLAESLAMGVPVIHGKYAAGAEFVPEEYLVEPVISPYRGGHAIRRPVFRASDWADRVQQVKWDQALLPEYIYWDQCWPEWKSWLLRGIE
jgi:hypothetical protein